ncbi:MAG: A/G-specific adenine glycosylase [Deltaproteobacteria bacterium]|nr:MAG: A/G-specific adenine glycosylase [Deltaproteobacteria bacterium]
MRCDDAIDRLIAWYAENHRDLPWRRTDDPYAIWISEVMLQQTRVETVLPYYRAFLACFPTVMALAGASEEAVLKAWEGLGYYSRARNLHRAARRIVAEHGGRLPSDPEVLRKLPGFGPYTTAAVASLAFGIDLAAVDGNVRRVIARLYAVERDPRKIPRRIEAYATELLPPGRGGIFNAAMMELGALLCTPRRPQCGRCPLEARCQARGKGNPTRYPVRERRPQRPHRRYVAGVVARQGCLLVGRRPSEGLLGGLWEFPAMELPPEERVSAATCERAIRETTGVSVRTLSPLPEIRHGFTHFSMTLFPFHCAWEGGEGEVGHYPVLCWADPGKLEALPFTRVSRRLLDLLTPLPLPASDHLFRDP